MDNLQNPKLRQIITTASDLFMRYGIRRTSIEEICRESNVSKMTFYRHFKNKSELVIFIIKQIEEQGLERFNHILSQDIPYPEKIKLFIQMKIEQAEIVSVEFIKDLMHDADPIVTEYYQNLVHERMKLFIQHLIEAQKNGDIRPDVKPEFILYILNRMTTMIDDDALLQLYDSTKELTAELNNFFFYGILARGKKYDNHQK